jgi:glycosyltransferase involved in cell wall biosynthesis
MILVISAINIASSGGVTYLVNLLQYASRHEVGFSKIYVFVRGNVCPSLRNLASEKIILVPVSNLSIVRFFWYWFVFSRICQDLGPQIVFCLGSIAPPLPKKQKMVTICLNILPFQFEDLMGDGFGSLCIRLIQRYRALKAYSVSRGIIFLSRNTQKIVESQMKKNVSNKRRQVIPLGIDLQFFTRGREKSETSYRTLLYVSSFKSYKQHCLVIKAFSKLAYKRDNLRLVFIGSGDAHVLDDIKRTIARLNLTDYVDIIGQLNYADLIKYYHNAFVFIFASTAESCSTILFEAMATGCPIACSNHPPMPEFAEDGAVYFNPRDVDSIYKALSLLINDPILRKRVSERAYQLVQQYSYERCAKDVFLLLEQIGASNLALKG